MLKLFNILLLVSLTGFCTAKPPVKTIAGGPYNGVLITEITNRKSSQGNEHSIGRMLYASNQTGDSLAVYTISEGAVSTAVSYSIVAAKNGLYFIARPIYSDQEATDSVRIGFSDADHSVQISKNDHYLLYPAFYSWFKQQVQAKHSVMAVLNLLQDKIGDYPTADTFPLLLFTPQPQTGKSIQQAKVVTTRSQADMTDTWTCTYHYNKTGRLDSLRAAADKEIRFYKKINYAGNNASTTKTYSNVEDRQITDQTITFPIDNNSPLKVTERVFEPGKNLHTTLSTTFTKRNLGPVKSINMPQAEVLKLIKAK
jgi:Zn/Cd-binding protein ZinT